MPAEREATRGGPAGGWREPTRTRNTKSPSTGRRRRGKLSWSTVSSPRSLPGRKIVRLSPSRAKQLYPLRIDGFVQAGGPRPRLRYRSSDERRGDQGQQGGGGKAMHDDLLSRCASLFLYSLSALYTGRGAGACQPATTPRYTLCTVCTGSGDAATHPVTSPPPASAA